MSDPQERTSAPGPLPSPRNSTPPPPAPWQHGPGGAPESPGNGSEGAPMAPRVQTPAAGVPGAPRSPGSPASVPPPGTPHDVWRDRFRVARDGAIYIAVVVAMYRLRMADKLDWGTTVAMLLVAGIRAQNIGDFIARRAEVAPGSRAAMMLAVMHVDPATFRSLFRG